jgi:hypothetical protein
MAFCEKCSNSLRLNSKIAKLLLTKTNLFRIWDTPLETLFSNPTFTPLQMIDQAPPLAICQSVWAAQ